MAEVLTEALRGEAEDRMLGLAGGAAAPVTCGCDLRTWRSSSARAAAASVRLLRALDAVRGDAAGIFAAARSEDAAMACPVSFKDLAGGDPRGGAIQDFSAVTLAYHLVQEQLDMAQQSTTRDSDEHGADACVPGALAICLACIVVVIERRMWHWAAGLYQIAQALLLGTAECAGPFAGPANGTVQGATWEPLAVWQRDPSAFLVDIMAPFVESDLWWRGRQPVEDPLAHAQNESLSRCAGLSDGRQECEADDPTGEGVVQRGPSDAPLTQVLGVGLMKAGSTLVLQSLRAATGLPSGMDCTAPGALWSVERRRAPLSRALAACSEEVFKWELAKDPLLTPLANRLALAWPAVSRAGEGLRLFAVLAGQLAEPRPLHPGEAALPGRRAARPKVLRLRRRRRAALGADRRRVPALPRALRAGALRGLLCRPGRGGGAAARAAGARTPLDPRGRRAGAARVGRAVPGGAGRAQRGGDAATDFGPGLFRRLAWAVAQRAVLLGYGRPAEAGGEPEDPVDMPALPGRACGA
ncbi:unnamed protein product [Prorocentrum cordatum]|uniref:Uncharacterized protein n=1 Tax=Prorocentrum cordatum TaxID=2364126 RepID=A0ABN9X049_9DINO|nr:unnamed protein product [Polarella glacialis]